MVTEAEARRQRPLMSGLVALTVALAAAIVWYYAGKPSDSQQPVQTVEWKPWVTAGRDDGKLALLAPSELPNGWRARFAEYQSGVSPTWRLAMLTGAGRFVGLEEGRETVSDLIAKSTDGDATQGAGVDIDGVSWQSWTAGGDYVLVRALKGPAGDAENVIVYGSAPASEIRSFASTLSAPPES